MWRCRRCGDCCTRITPDLTCLDLIHLARHLKLPIPEVVGRYCVVIRASPFSALYRLKLRRRHQAILGGRPVPELGVADLTSPCIFWDNRLCGLHDTPAKPTMCQRYRCDAAVRDVCPYWERRYLEDMGAVVW